MYKNSHEVVRELWRHRSLFKLRSPRCYSTKKELEKNNTPSKNKLLKRHDPSKPVKTKVIVPKRGVLHLFYKTLTNKILSSVLHVVPNITKEENISKLADFRFNEEIIQRYVELKKRRAMQFPNKCLEDPGPILIQYESRHLKDYKKEYKSGLKFLSIFNLAATLEKNFKTWKRRITKDSPIQTSSDSSENLLLYDNLLKNAVIMDSVMPNVKAMYEDSNLFDFRLNGGIMDTKNNYTDNEKPNPNMIRSFSKINSSKVSNDIAKSLKISNFKVQSNDNNKKVPPKIQNTDSPKTYNVKTPFSPPPKRPLYKQNLSRNESVIKPTKGNEMKENRKVSLTVGGNKLTTHTLNQKQRDGITHNQTVVGSQKDTKNEESNLAFGSDQKTETKNYQNNIKMKEEEPLLSPKLPNASLPYMNEEDVTSISNDSNINEKENLEQLTTLKPDIKNENESIEPTRSDNSDLSHSSVNVPTSETNTKKDDKSKDKLKENLTSKMVDHPKEGELAKEEKNAAAINDAESTVTINSKTPQNKISNIKSNISKPQSNTNIKHPSKANELQTTVAVALKVKDEDDVYLETRPQIVADCVKADHVNLNIVIEEEECSKPEVKSKPQSAAVPTSGPRHRSFHKLSKHGNNEELSKYKEQSNIEGKKNSPSLNNPMTKSSMKSQTESENYPGNLDNRSGQKINETKQFVDREKGKGISTENVQMENSNRNSGDKKIISKTEHNIKDSRGMKVVKGKQISENTLGFDDEEIANPKFIKNVQNNEEVKDNTRCDTKQNIFENNKNSKAGNVSKKDFPDNKVSRVMPKVNLSQETTPKTDNKAYINSSLGGKGKLLTPKEVKENDNRNSKLIDSSENFNENLKTSVSETRLDNKADEKVGNKTVSRANSSQPVRVKRIKETYIRNFKASPAKQENPMVSTHIGKEKEIKNQKSIVESKGVNENSESNGREISYNNDPDEKLMGETERNVNDFQEVKTKFRDKIDRNHLAERKTIKVEPMAMKNDQNIETNKQKSTFGYKSYKVNSKNYDSEKYYKTNYDEKPIRESERKLNDMQEINTKNINHMNKNNQFGNQIRKLKPMTQKNEEKFEIKNQKPTFGYTFDNEKPKRKSSDTFKNEDPNEKMISKTESKINQFYETKIKSSSPDQPSGNETKKLEKPPSGTERKFNDAQEMNKKISNQMNKNDQIGNRIKKLNSMTKTNEQKVDIRNPKPTFGSTFGNEKSKINRSDTLENDDHNKKIISKTEYQINYFHETKIKSSSTDLPSGNELKKVKTETKKGERIDEVSDQKSTVSCRSDNQDSKDNRSTKNSPSDRNPDKMFSETNTNPESSQNPDKSVKTRKRLQLSKFSPVGSKTNKSMLQKTKDTNEVINERDKVNSYGIDEIAKQPNNENTKKLNGYGRTRSKDELQIDVSKEKSTNTFEKGSKRDSSREETIKAKPLKLNELQSHKTINDKLKHSLRGSSDNLNHVENKPIFTEKSDEILKNDTEFKVNVAKDVSQKKAKQTTTGTKDAVANSESNADSSEKSKRKRLKLKEAPISLVGRNKSRIP